MSEATHTDHQTWFAFSLRQAALLRNTLEQPSGLTKDEATSLLDVLDRYEEPSAKNQAFRDGAAEQRFVRDGECEIDDCAVVSASDNGAYVMAWVWCPNEDAGIEESGEDEDEGEGE